MKAASGLVAAPDSPLLETFTNIAHLQNFQVDEHSPKMVLKNARLLRVMMPSNIFII
jgi:hypothetical protein